MKLEKKSIGQLKKIADKVFSEYIRRRDKGVCFSCGNVKNWKYQQAGHFVSRSYNRLRYDERNCHAQCMACNCYRAGNMAEYAERLEEKYGKGIIQQLNKEKRNLLQFKPKELLKIIEYYNGKNKE